MTEYTIADVSPGDRVTLEHDNTKYPVEAEAFIREGQTFLELKYASFSLSVPWMLARGWRITDLVKPEPELPTEPYTPTLAELLDAYGRSLLANNGWPTPESMQAIGAARVAIVEWSAAHDREVAERAWSEGKLAATEVIWSGTQYELVANSDTANPYTEESQND